MIYLLLHVDGMLISITNMDNILDLKWLIANEFDMHNVKPARKILDIEII